MCCGPVVHGNEARCGVVFIGGLGLGGEAKTLIDTPLQDNASCVNVLYI